MRVVEVVHQRRVRCLVEVVDTELVLDELDSRFVHTDGALANVHLVVDIALHHRHDSGELAVPLRGGVGRTRDDQRCTRLVDEDRVDLVDDRRIVTALDQVVQRVGHVVAQIVEAELVVRAVGDVGGVRSPAFRGCHARENHADLEAQEAVDAAHPLRVALGQVVVDGDHVDALVGDRIEIRRQSAGQRLALAGLHLGDVAEV